MNAARFRLQHWTRREFRPATCSRRRCCGAHSPTYGIGRLAHLLLNVSTRSERQTSPSPSGRVRSCARTGRNCCDAGPITQRAHLPGATLELRTNCKGTTNRASSYVSLNSRKVRYARCASTCFPPKPNGQQAANDDTTVRRSAIRRRAPQGSRVSRFPGNHSSAHISLCHLTTLLTNLRTQLEMTGVRQLSWHEVRQVESLPEPPCVRKTNQRNQNQSKHSNRRYAKGHWHKASSRTPLLPLRHVPCPETRYPPRNSRCLRRQSFGIH